MPPGDESIRPLRVLVVDDDPHERPLAVTVLVAAGFDAVPVGDALTFGEELARGTFDAVVLEARVRWAEGLAILDAVKRAGRHRAVLLFTAAPGDDAVLAAFRRGLDDSVPKSPRGFVELPGLVRAAVKRATSDGALVDTSLGRLLERLERAVFQCDLDGRLLDANRAFTELLGFSLRSDALRANAFELCLPDAVREGVLRRLKEQRFVREESLALVARDGASLRVSVALSVVADDQRGKVVTGLVERVEPARSAGAPGGFDTLPGRAMVVAHDLKEPLRTIARSSEQLRTRYAGRLDPEADEQLAFLHEAAGRMQAQVKKLFERAAPAPREPTSEREPTLTGEDDPEAGPGETSDAAAVLQQVLDHLGAAIETTGARVTSGPLPVVALAHDALLQLLQNVVGNALKFRRDEPPRVHLSAERRDELWLFSVSDNGVGIAPEHAEGIFEMFDRGGATARTPGTGIGLAVCRRIVERHGGRIWVHSRPGDGATFFFSLPAAPGAEKPAPPVRLRPKRADRG